MKIIEHVIVVFVLTQELKTWESAEDSGIQAVDYCSAPCQIFTLDVIHDGFKSLVETVTNYASVGTCVI